MENIEIANYFLDQFNTNTNEKFKIIYDESKKEFVRVSHDLAHKHYFDDYGLLTINWFIKIKNIDDIDDWIDQEIYIDRIFDNFRGRRSLFPDEEPETFIKLFNSLKFDISYLSDVQKSKLETQLNEHCSLAGSYIQ